jgi:pimeloyl-ACP methyl ester carboxylesterase
LPNEEFTLPEITKSVWAFLDSINVKTCFVIGHSLGGYVTLEMAKQKPERMNGFCLFHSTAYADDENKKQNRTKVMEFVSKNGTTPFVQTLMPSLFADPNHSAAKFLLDEAKKIDSKTVIAYARAMRDREEMTKVYVTFSKPILFFIGLKDGVIPPDTIWKQAEEVQQKRVHELINVAHMGMLEASSETQKVLLDFLEEVFQPVVS